MYDYLSGLVARLDSGLAVVDCGGVGYACRTTAYTLSRLKQGEKGRLFTYLSVKEDAMELYGFSTQEERTLFRHLISVSGVGPKAALSILSCAPPESLALSIITGDERTLTGAPGIGKKIAQRIILELKDKLAGGQEGFSGGGRGGAVGTVIPENKRSEAGAALAVLGYSQGEIGAVLRDLPLEELSLEDIIRQALKKLAK